MLRKLTFALGLCCELTCYAHATVGIGDALADSYVLSGLDGRAMRLADYPASKARLIVFFSVECPTSRVYADHMSRIHVQYGPRGITLIAVNANFIISLVSLCVAVGLRCWVEVLPRELSWIAVLMVASGLLLALSLGVPHEWGVLSLLARYLLLVGRRAASLRAPAPGMALAVALALAAVGLTARHLSALVFAAHV